MPEFYTWTILLINQLGELGEEQLSVFGSRGGQICPLMYVPFCKWVVNDKPFCKTAVSKKMCKESRLTCITKHVIRSSPSLRFSFSVISDKNNKGHHSQT